MRLDGGEKRKKRKKRLGGDPRSVAERAVLAGILAAESYESDIRMLLFITVLFIILYYNWRYIISIIIIIIIIRNQKESTRPLHPSASSTWTGGMNPIDDGSAARRK